MEHCILSHLSHEWIENSNNLIWIICPLDKNLDYSYCIEEEVKITNKITPQKTWYKLNRKYFVDHCQKYHLTEHNTFKQNPHIDLYPSQNKNPTFYLGLYNPQTGEAFMYSDNEYIKEYNWFADKNFTHLQTIYQQLGEKINQHMQQQEQQQIEEQYTPPVYSNYTSGGPEQKGVISLGILAAILGTLFIVTIFYFMLDYSGAGWITTEEVPEMLPVTIESKPSSVELVPSSVTVKHVKYYSG